MLSGPHDLQSIISLPIYRNGKLIRAYEAGVASVEE